MILASNIGENNSKCEFYTFNLVLGWYAVSTVLCMEEIVSKSYYNLVHEAWSIYEVLHDRL